MSLDTSKIKWYPLPESEYHKQEYPKSQITLHHTASGGNSKGDIDYWNSPASPGAIATPFVVDRAGQIWQCFSSKYYAAHLGVPASTFKKFGINSSSDKLHKSSIGIEIDNWGWLNKKGDKFYSYAGVEVPAENVITYAEPFKGFKYYEKYTKEQIAAVKDLVEYLCGLYKISKVYNPTMWNVSKEALQGKNGIWTHVSYRETGKQDCHPMPALIEMLKSL